MTKTNLIAEPNENDLKTEKKHRKKIEPKIKSRFYFGNENTNWVFFAPKFVDRFIKRTKIKLSGNLYISNAER